MSRTDPPSDSPDGRRRPLVWVKKLVLYKSIDPPDEIRQIAFTTGLNIIQGEADESDEEFQSGHGIGKTTVCRLIRYCLGEKSYGQKHVVEEVKHCFPDSYVGAEVELDGADWAVLRPLGNPPPPTTREVTSETVMRHPREEGSRESIRPGPHSLLHQGVRPSVAAVQNFSRSP